MLLPNDFLILSVADAKKILSGLRFLCPDPPRTNGFYYKLIECGLLDYYEQLDCFVKNKEIQDGLTNKYINEVL